MLRLSVDMQPDPEASIQELQRRLNAAQTWMTEECKKGADVFTPLDTGDLRDEIEYTTNEQGAIDGWTYKAKGSSGYHYAHRQWWGLTDDGRPFVYNAPRADRVGSNPEARSRWTEHAAANIREQIIAGVKKILEGKA